MKTLVIGGPDDGRRKDFSTGTYIKQCAKFAPLYGSAPVFNDPTLGIVTHTYTIKNYNHPDGSRSQIAVHSSVKDIMKQLVKGYRYHRNPRRR